MPVMPATFKGNKTNNKTHLSNKDNWGKGRGGRPWRRLRDSVLVRDNYLCQCEECREKGLYTIANEVDHIIPKFKGGTDDLDNLRAINNKCHAKKTQQENKSNRYKSK